ncbi:MAG: nucleotidyltransferase family protein [Clostridia bacterium]|nr:nucleotidyltransferase family protein [Clostridia bacterium]
MMKIENLFLTLIRSHLNDTNLSLEVKELLKEQEILASLYSISKKHDLAHLVADVLDKNKLLEDNQISRAFIQQRHMAVFRDEQMQYEREHIKQLFNDNDIEFVLLKGSRVRDWYPKTWMRTSCDIDILIHESEIEKAIDLLEKTGYISEKRSYRDISLIAPSGVHIELHFSLKQALKEVDSILEKVWDYSEPPYNLKIEFFYFHIIAHTAYHFRRGGCGIRPFIDLWLINKQFDIEKEIINEFCRKGGLETFYQVAIRLVVAWFGDGAMDDKLCEIQDYLFSSGLYGSLENRVAIETVKYGGRCRYIFHRLFLPYEVLKEYYPRLQGRKWLTFFYQIRRWTEGLFSKEKRKRALAELQADNEGREKSLARIMEYVNL